MGDGRRFRFFADFIEAAFPEARHIADVGGGRGLLAVELMLRGLVCTVIDPRRPTKLPRQVRKKIRKEMIRRGTAPPLEAVTNGVDETDLAPYDLIVGMHPDEATEPIVRSAVEWGKPFAVAPCCVMPLDGEGRTFEEWMDYLVSLAPGCKTATLPMEGRNVVIYRTAEG